MNISYISKIKLVQVMYSLGFLALFITGSLITVNAIKDKSNFMFTESVMNIQNRINDTISMKADVECKQRAKEIFSTIEALKVSYGKNRNRQLLLLTLQKKVSLLFDLKEELYKVQKEISAKVGGKTKQKTYRSEMEQFSRFSLCGEFLLALEAIERLRDGTYEQYNQFFMKNHMQTLHQIVQQMCIILHNPDPALAIGNNQLGKLFDKNKALLARIIHSARSQ